MPRDQVDTANSVRARKLFGPAISVRDVDAEISIPPHWHGRRAPTAAPSDLWLRVLAAHLGDTTRSARSGTADFHNARF